MKRLGLTVIVFSAACGGSGSSSTDAGTDAAIEDGVAYGISKTNTQALYKATL